MAIYHNHTKIIGRQAKDSGGNPLPGKRVSMLAKAAYRSGDALTDFAIGKRFDYQSRSHEVVRSGILAPEHSPAGIETNEAQDGTARKAQREIRQRLWNLIETVERRKDSQLAREFELGLPRELSTEEQAALVRDWCLAYLVSKGYVVDYSIHRSKDGQNPHAHVVCTMRPVDENAQLGFGKKPDMYGKFNGRGIVGKGAKADLEDWRETWAVAENQALKAAGRTERVDHRTLEAQGIDRVPGRKIGVSASAMERKGLKTERGKFARWAKMDSLTHLAVRDIEETGEVSQFGIGATWYERAQVAIGETATRLGELLRDESSGGGGLPSLPLSRDSDWTDYIMGRRNRGTDIDLG